MVLWLTSGSEYPRWKGPGKMNSSPARGVEMTLGEKQELFARLWCVFGNWFHGHPRWRMREGEGYVALTDGADGDHDGPHMAGGAHYNKLGRDFDFFVLELNGSRSHLTTDHPYWHEVGEFWKSLHPLCRWGGDFHTKDYNHLSLFHAGVQ